MSTIKSSTKAIAVSILLALSGAALAQTAGEPPTAPAAPAPPVANARELCVQALNADPEFAASVVKTVDAAKRDADTLAAHVDANKHVQKNQRHVIYAYAAMWIIAAGFVLFLWRRQQALQTEIAALRRDLEIAGAGDAKARS